MSDDLDAKAHARVGSTLNDKWTLERLIGIGGMAAVYAGKHRNGARAAVKVLHPDISKVKEARERFVREGYAANSVEHPGVVKVLDDDTVSGGDDDGTVYLVMELLEGESLEDRIERGPPMTEDEVVPVMKGILEVLVAAHAKGIIHRDIKPENLFIAKMEDGSTRVKVLDFGLARMQERSIQTVYGLALGTPSYMPPEQAAGRITEIDGRSDLFALGASCFRLVAGRSVHPGSNPLEIVMKMAKEPAPKLRSVAPNVSERFAAIIDKALEFKRDNRYADAAAMLADVEALGSPEAAKPLPPPPAPAPAPAPAKSAPKLDEPRPETTSLPVVPSLHGIPKKPLWPIFLVLGLAGVAGWLVWDTFLKKPATTPEADAAVTFDAESAADVTTVDAGALAPADSGVKAIDDAATDATVDAASDAGDAGSKDAGKDGGVKDAGIKDSGVKDAGKPKPKPKPTK